MNKRALLNAVVRNIMTKVAAQQSQQDAEPPALPVIRPEQFQLDPSLSSPGALEQSGGLFDLMQDKFGERPHLKYNVTPGYVEYSKPNGDFIADVQIQDASSYDTFREALRNAIAANSAQRLYPFRSRNYKDFIDAAKRFGEYRQLQQQNQGTLKNSLQFDPWARKNAPQVHRKLMNAPKKNRDEALQILKWIASNRRNKGSQYA